MFKLKILYLLIIVLNYYSCFSQDDIEVSGTISGIVISDSGVHIEYAHITVYTLQDSIITGTITEPSGKFLIKNVPFGKYSIECKYLGFNKEKISDIIISNKNRNIKLKKISLKPNKINLNEVEIYGNDKFIDYQIDKKVINVGSETLNSGGNAIDVLENTPSVQVDIHENVKLRGANFILLIDGKPTILSASKELKLIPANDIDKIEIITNPSAKYDPDGSGGIINVITKKQKQIGISGLVSLSAGTLNNYKGNLILNYKKKKFIIKNSINLGNKNKLYTDEYYRRSNYSDTILLQDAEIEKKFNDKSFGFNTGIKYFINPKNMAYVSFRYNNQSKLNNDTYNYYENSLPVVTENSFIQKNNRVFKGDLYGIYLIYSWVINKESKKEINIIANTVKNESSSDLSLIVDTVNSNWDTESIYYDEKLTKTSIMQVKRLIKIEYSQKVHKKGVFEIGCKYSYEKVANNSYYEFNIEDYFSDDFQNNDFIYYNIIQSAYTTYSDIFGKFGYKLGLRTEFYNRITDQITIGEKESLNFFDPFPTIHLHYKFSKKQQIQTSYSRRIFRLYGNYLNPFLRYTDSYNILTGNPNLKSEYTDSYELNYINNFKSFYVSTEFYYKQTNNTVNRIQSLYDDNIMLHKYENLDKSYSLGIEFMLNVKFYKWWTVNASSNIYNYSVEGTIVDNGNNDINIFDFKLNNIFKFKKNFKIQITGFYYSPTITAQTKLQELYLCNLVLKKTFLDKKLDISLKFQDLLNTSFDETIIESDNFYSVYKSRTFYPSIFLQLSYKFDNK